MLTKRRSSHQCRTRAIKLHAIAYFARPYRDEPSQTRRVIKDKEYTVYRPNHGIAHSIRQGFLVRDTVTLILEDKTNIFHNWLAAAIKEDEHFIIKLAILSSFQRSGRESEVSSSVNSSLYFQYERADCTNFIEALSASDYFTGEEAERWSTALLWNNDDTVGNIRLLIKVAHTMDLRRIIGFNKQRIMAETAALLGVSNSHPILTTLWNQAGLYLHVSGDRDLEKQKDWYSNRFYTLQYQPCQLYWKLRECMIR